MSRNFASRRHFGEGSWRILLVLALLITIAQGLNSEGQLLLELKKSLHDEYNHLWNWKSTDETPCGWIGVNCSLDYELVVSSVDLSSMNLSGTLGPSIGGLTHLTFLDLSYNKFSGDIPKEIGNCSLLVALYLNNNHFSGPIPVELGKLSYLKSLNICNNKISGSLPEELGNLSSLVEFVAYTNNLTGPLPRSIGNLRKLRTFRAGQNTFSGNIPAEISGCQSLEMLGLAQNHIGGELPKEVGMLQSLTDLILWENQLSGFIPKELGNCTSLETLALYANQLVGPIPVEIVNLKFLNKLYLYRNQLNGSIPREIGNLSLATEIDLSENHLTGEIPTAFSKIKGLQLLYLFENRLTGVIPNELSSLKNLTKLDLSINHLTGPIPYGFQYFTKMIQLQLFENFLSGTIPQQLGLYSPLWVVDFSNNHLTGKIPPYLCWHSNLILLNLGGNILSGNISTGIENCETLVQLRLKLQRLDLSHNSFVDTLPNEVGTLTQLEILRLSENKFSGHIPEAMGNLSRLTELQMGGNLFSGEIPRQLGSLSSLQIAMNLSNNRLTGNIPLELGFLNMLEYLLLNNNNLSGEIPSTFESLSSLMVCNLSYNNLTGPLPAIPLFQNMPASSFIENKGLCGTPLQSCTGDSSSPSMLPAKKDTRGRIITTVSCAVGGVSLILIVILIYQMRRPRKSVPSSNEKETPSPAQDIYFHPKEGFTFQDLIEATNNFHESFIVGRGACGTVYKAVMHSGQTVAVKRLESNAEGNNIENSFRAEILTLGKIRHRNIVKLYGFCYHRGFNVLLYEYLENGSLGEVLHGASCSLDWSMRFMIALGAAEGLAYLHHDCKPRIIHRDIKSNNILLDENFEAHVGDFGLAKVIDMPQSKSMSAIAGSYGYIAPEYAYTMKVTEKCDIYSYGVVLLELLTGKTPVQALDQGGDLVTRVRHYVRNHSLTTGILDDRLNLDDRRIVDHMITVLKIALICTSLSPFDRPSMREVVTMLIESKRQDQEDSFGKSPACSPPKRSAS
ncbi:hypothetical protein F383_16784 [Gossypium arboreum]|uniref:non-specific serine/threonine protein kinase n=1 Tax=Gossypium arboreum TaxID=29729 RepID=A0A0B0MDS8_GOSAR|nr:hypothetical protein F383_16784 [Gossypium arboreum]